MKDENTILVHKRKVYSPWLLDFISFGLAFSLIRHKENVIPNKKILFA